MASPRGRGRPQDDQITEPQKRALQEIRGFIGTRKYPPTMSELGELLDVTAASAHQLVVQLERKGYVTREPRKARSLNVIREPKQELDELVAVPLLGIVKAGPAMLAEENRLGEVLVEKTVAGSGRCFALRVSGDSMIGARMADGDVVIVRQQPIAESGDIVIALLGDEATMKRLYIRGDRVELRPENKKYPSIIVDPDTDVRILGKVVAVHSR